MAGEKIANIVQDCQEKHQNLVGFAVIQGKGKFSVLENIKKSV